VSDCHLHTAVIHDTFRFGELPTIQLALRLPRVTRPSLALSGHNQLGVASLEDINQWRKKRNLVQVATSHGHGLGRYCLGMAWALHMIKCSPGSPHGIELVWVRFQIGFQWGSIGASGVRVGRESRGVPMLSGSFWCISTPETIVIDAIVFGYRI